MTPSRVVATWFGAGLVPVAPGTVGTLATVPLYLALWLGGAPWWALPLTVFAVAALGVLVAGRTARELGTKDPGQVVIDESAGYLLACCGGAAGWPTALMAFVLFRLFDITKPWPVRQLERLPGGWGIMMDDIAAGAMAGALIWHTVSTGYGMSSLRRIGLLA